MNGLYKALPSLSHFNEPVWRNVWYPQNQQVIMVFRNLKAVAIRGIENGRHFRVSHWYDYLEKNAVIRGLQINTVLFG